MKPAVWVLAMMVMLAVVACGQGRDVSRRIDSQWHHEMLMRTHASRWLQVAASAENGFVPSAVDRKWQPIPSEGSDLVGQARAILVLAAGYRATGELAYLERLKLGTEFLLTHFRDRSHGGWYTAVNADGTTRNSNKRLYGHAFAILALAHAYDVAKDPRCIEAAIQTWQDIRLRFADRSGGYQAAFNRDFSRSLGDNSQNPIMHLFEAMLALYETSHDSNARDGANAISHFVVYRLLRGEPDGRAYIPELYDSEWHPLDKRRGGYVDVGHQFEWAYLLSAGEAAGLNPILAAVAERLLNYALARGYDSAAGGAYTSVAPDGEVVRDKGYWQQAETLRALMHHAVVRGRNDLWGRVTQVTEFIDSEFVDHENGGWYPKVAAECRKGRCPDRQPDGYHMVVMHAEALRLVQLRR